MCSVDDKASWIEIALTVTPEQAEAVAEVLGRYTREGVVIEQLADSDNSSELTKLNPQVRVFGYFFADASAEERKLKLEQALWYLGRIQPLPAAEYRLVKDQDWMEAWKKHYQPVMIGKRLVIVPAWMDKEYPGRIPIRINPGMAFGTGTHPTTQLCLEFLEEFVQADQTVMDIGCGSGILSAAAVKLGARRVLAVDIDPASVKSTQENCGLNGVSSHVSIEKGSVALVCSGHFEIATAPLVVANILASVIMSLFDEGLADLVEPGGLLLLSGILAHQADEVIVKARENGLTLRETKRIEDWVALALVK
jgi:ribosomal protein L11 methyltransferase